MLVNTFLHKVHMDTIQSFKSFRDSTIEINMHVYFYSKLPNTFACVFESSLCITLIHLISEMNIIHEYQFAFLHKCI